MDYELIVNQKQQRFEYHFENGNLAYVDYRIKDNVYYLPYSFVSPEMSGKGIGGRLVMNVFDYIRTLDKKAVAQCGFVHKVLMREEFEDIRA